MGHRPLNVGSGLDSVTVLGGLVSPQYRLKTKQNLNVEGRAKMVVFVVLVFVEWEADCDRLFWP